MRLIRQLVVAALVAAVLSIGAATPADAGPGDGGFRSSSSHASTTGPGDGGWSE